MKWSAKAFTLAELLIALAIKEGIICYNNTCDDI